MDTLKDRLDLASRVISPKSGRVNERFKAPGSFLRTGEAILNLETYSPGRQFLRLRLFRPRTRASASTRA